MQVYVGMYAVSYHSSCHVGRETYCLLHGPRVDRWMYSAPLVKAISLSQYGKAPRQFVQYLQALLGSRLNDHSCEGDVSTDSHGQPVMASAAATHELRLMHLALHAKEVKA